MKASRKFSCPKSVLLLAIIAVFSQYSYGIWFGCWDNPRQCHGDADGYQSGPFWVYMWDLNIFVQAHRAYVSDQNYDPRADFNRDGVIDDWWDLAIIEHWFGKVNVPADCPGKLRINSMDGKILLAGTNYTITWDDLSGHCIDGELFYSIDNGINWTQIDPGLKDGCSCNWIVPDANSEQCLIDIDYWRHYPVPYTSPVTDTTGPFTIYKCPLATESDYNNDCYIDFYDFALLADMWLLTGGTDMNDLLEMSQNWCTCGNPYDPTCTE
ncbi:MAG: hypothetical protein ACYSYL_10975 [Planctomycetota bacterium]